MGEKKKKKKKQLEAEGVKEDAKGVGRDKKKEKREKKEDPSPLGEGLESAATLDTKAPVSAQPPVSEDTSKINPVSAFFEPKLETTVTDPFIGRIDEEIQVGVKVQAESTSH